MIMIIMKIKIIMMFITHHRVSAADSNMDCKSHILPPDHHYDDDCDNDNFDEGRYDDDDPPDQDYDDHYYHCIVLILVLMLMTGMRTILVIVLKLMFIAYQHSQATLKDKKDVWGSGYTLYAIFICRYFSDLTVLCHHLTSGWF